eukprot:9309841-Alexandrium_andersonii.AAC.1
MPETAPLVAPLLPAAGTLWCYCAPQGRPPRRRGPLWGARRRRSRGHLAGPQAELALRDHARAEPEVPGRRE